MEREYTFLTDLTDDIFISYLININVDYLTIIVKVEYVNDDIVTARTKYSTNQINQMAMSTLDIPMFIFEHIMNEIKQRCCDLPLNKKYLKFTQRLISDLYIYVDNLKRK